MLQLGPSSRLACSLRQQGSLFTNTIRYFSGTQPQQFTQQLRVREVAGVAVAAAAGQAVPGPGQAAAQSAQSQQKAAQQLTVLATDPTATQLLAHFFACELRPADCYLLFGSVGAGKSHFRRARRATPVPGMACL